jgi:hypothetical protein
MRCPSGRRRATPVVLVVLVVPVVLALVFAAGQPA